jgi:hypothetical protein
MDSTLTMTVRVLLSGWRRAGATTLPARQATNLDQLAELVKAALEVSGADREACRAHAERYSWRSCAEMFLGQLVALMSPT